MASESSPILPLPLLRLQPALPLRSLATSWHTSDSRIKAKGRLTSSELAPEMPASALRLSDSRPVLQAGLSAKPSGLPAD